MKIESTDPRAIRAGQAFPQRLQEVHEGRIVLRDTAVYRSNGSYNKQHTIDVKCTVCGCEWSPPAFSLNLGKGCPDCVRLKNIASAGIKRRRPSTPAQRELARIMRENDMTYDEISAVLGRDDKTIRCWLDADQREKARLRAEKYHARNKASGRQAELSKNYYQTDHGRESRAKHQDARRALYYQCNGFECIDDVWYEDDLWSYVEKDKEGRELMSFPGADKAYAFRNKQCQAFERWSGEPYARDHVIPLSRGGIHHPLNFQNLPAAINNRKHNNTRECDIALFCKRIFDL